MKRDFSTFSEDTLAILDFARCQRADGTFYGTGGQCRKGKEVGERERAEKTSSQKAPKGLFSAGSDVDIYEVEKKAEKWRQAAGLDAFPGTLDWKHDRVHALVHEFVGGHGKIGEWVGQGPKTPTPAEETLVNMVHRASALKARGDSPKLLDDTQLEKYFVRDIQFMQGRGNIKDEDAKHYFKESGDVNVEKFISKYREMEATPGFDKLLDASHRAFTNAGEIFFNEHEKD
jgi:hypothetical protein